MQGGRGRLSPHHSFYSHSLLYYTYYITFRPVRIKPYGRPDLELNQDLWNLAPQCALTPPAYINSLFLPKIENKGLKEQ